MQQIRYWLRGVRLYMALGILLVTLEVAWWANVSYAGTNLFSLRAEEVYAWLGVGCLVITLLIGPLYKLFAGLPGKLLMRDARRMLGIGAAWFSALHVAVAEFGLYKGANPLHLQTRLAWGFGIGLGALFILLALAGTSFDAALQGMRVWWFRLHRLVYVAGGLIVAHAMLVGVHAGRARIYVWLIAFTALLIGLHVVMRRNRRRS
ncbi:MAG TPA: ferric reductase-like transmembrane domain-containing protein [Candidatus Saccharimonadales bacterium]|nr:ferric reductase-like transmembrane domain-containing protein [Candidatus Saccharimonadales bacterium]